MIKLRTLLGRFPRLTSATAFKSFKDIKMSNITGNTPFIDYMNQAFGVKVDPKDVKPIKLTNQPAKKQSTENKGQEGEKPSKKADKKAAKKAEKEAKKQAHKQAKGGAQQVQEEEFKKDPNDPSAHLFGDAPINKSEGVFDVKNMKEYTKLEDVTEAIAGKTITVRGRAHTVRAKSSKLAFVVLREKFYTLQAVLSASETVSAGMVKFAGKIPMESIV